MGRPIRLTLLGGFSLRIGGVKASKLPRKVRAMLAFLALAEGRPISREAVGELLWPGRGAEQVRHSLRQALLVLRGQDFGELEPIRAGDGTLALATAAVECDALGLRALAGAGERHELRPALELYAGPLLDQFPPVSADFDDWLVAARNAMQATALDILRRLFDAAMADADLAEAIAAAERMFAIDPLREDVHRWLMTACARAGRRSDALRHYATARKLLERELDVEPAAETEALAAEIRREMQPSAAAASLPVAPRHEAAPCIAVLPLLQFGDTTVPSHLANGLVADIVSQLAGLRDLSVISHGSTITFAGAPVDLREIGRRLGARYLLRGALRRAGDELRLTTELAEAATGRVTWARTSDMREAPSFADQDRIVGEVVNTLAPRVQELELHRIRGQRPDSLTAYDKLLLAREHMTSLERDAFIEARGLLDQVIAEEPDYAEAYSLAADWHGLVIGQGWTTDRNADVADVERLARKALTLDQHNVRALVFYGHRRSLWHRDYRGAQALFRRALDTAPSSAHAWRWSSFTYAYVGEAHEAVARATRALALSPCDRDLHSFYLALCVAHYTGGEYAAAAEWGRRALLATPALRSSAGWVAASLAAIGHRREAREIASNTMAEWPERRVRDVVAQHPYADAQRRERYGRHLVAAGFPE